MKFDTALLSRLMGRAAAAEAAVGALIRTLPVEQREAVKSALAREVERTDETQDYGLALRGTVKDILRYSEG